jgi:hypothetical protein
MGKIQIGSIVKVILTGDEGMIIDIYLDVTNKRWCYDVRMKDLSVKSFYEEELILVKNPEISQKNLLLEEH